MKAVICLRSFPPTIFEGVRAITTSTPAFTPFVHQSFSPLRMNSEPSIVGSAFKFKVAGIGSCLDFSQRECRNLTARYAWQIFLFLFFGTKQKQRLRYTYRLMRRNKCSNVSIPAAQQHRRTSII